MLYVSDQNETLEQLMNKEGFKGRLQDYKTQFVKLNPNLKLCTKIPTYTEYLPSYSLVCLVTEPPIDSAHSASVLQIVNEYTLDERRTLRAMQEDNFDIPSHVVSVSLLEEFQEYLAATKHVLNYPIFQTPIYEFNRALTRKHSIKVFGESMQRGAFLMENSSKYIQKNTLFELMKKRMELNLQLENLGNLKQHSAMRAKLNMEVKDLTKQIKKLVPQKLAGYANKHIHGYSPEQLKKMSRNSASLKVVRKGGAKKIKATSLDFLTTSGLSRYRRMIKGFKIIGKGVKQFATYLNYSLAAYEIYETYKKGGNFARTFFREGTAIATGLGLSAAIEGGLAGVGIVAIEFGASALGVAAGGLGTTILACFPVIGWVILVAAGAVTAGYISYKSKEAADYVWDTVESGYVKEKFYEFTNLIFKEFKVLGEQIIANDI